MVSPFYLSKYQLVVHFVGAAGLTEQIQHHQCQRQCNEFFHNFSLLLFALQRALCAHGGLLDCLTIPSALRNVNGQIQNHVFLTIQSFYVQAPIFSTFAQNCLISPFRPPCY